MCLPEIHTRAHLTLRANVRCTWKRHFLPFDFWTCFSNHTQLEPLLLEFSFNNRPTISLNFTTSKKPLAQFGFALFFYSFASISHISRHFVHKNQLQWFLVSFLAHFNIEIISQLTNDKWLLYLHIDKLNLSFITQRNCNWEINFLLRKSEIKLIKQEKTK